MPERRARSAVCRLAALAMACAAATGCVERKMTIRSTPPGADVYLNGEPVGQTPITVNFTWYGDYNITLRKRGYTTLSEGRRPPTPWWQVPPMDYFSENVWPGVFRDAHDYSFTLSPATQPVREELIERAIQTREDAAHPPE